MKLKSLVVYTGVHMPLFSYSHPAMPCTGPDPIMRAYPILGPRGTERGVFRVFRVRVRSARARRLAAPVRLRRQTTPGRWESHGLAPTADQHSPAAPLVESHGPVMAVHRDSSAVTLANELAVLGVTRVGAGCARVTRVGPHRGRTRFRSTRTR